MVRPSHSFDGQTALGSDTGPRVTPDTRRQARYRLRGRIGTDSDRALNGLPVNVLKAPVRFEQDDSRAPIEAELTPEATEDQIQQAASAGHAWKGFRYPAAIPAMSVLSSRNGGKAHVHDESSPSLIKKEWPPPVTAVTAKRAAPWREALSDGQFVPRGQTFSSVSAEPFSIPARTSASAMTILYAKMDGVGSSSVTTRSASRSASIPRPKLPLNKGWILRAERRAACGASLSHILEF